MGDIRERLNERRSLLISEEGSLRKAARNTNYPADQAVAARALAELGQIEDTLATYQLADAQRDLVIAQRHATAVQIEAIAEQRKANDAADKVKSSNEEAQFWSRRFLTNLLVANAAGFVAVLTFMLKQDSPPIKGEDVWLALQAFGIGTLLGAAMPLFRLIELRVGLGLHKLDSSPGYKNKFARFYSDNGLNLVGAVGGALLFATGMAVVIGCARGYYAARPAPAPDKVVERVVFLPAPKQSPL